ncbi:MAG TPA: PEP/pyruvate-binding domain-containing protein, partial [Acidobacteriota bacterium]|nr:PEP/pyruvate-binding domain-containing protein [Acidobacteriota bacterium]
MVQDEVVGWIDVCYTEERPPADEGPFLKEERKLIKTIAERLERRIFHERLKGVFEGSKKVPRGESQYAAIIDLLKRTDQKLLTRIARKMLYFLSWSGVEEARELIVKLSPAAVLDRQEALDPNRPLQRQRPTDLNGMSDEVFGLAVKYFSEKEVLQSIQKWIMEDRSNFLMKVLEDPGTTLPEIAASIERFHHLASHGMELDLAREKAFRVSLIRRLLSDDPNFVHVAKDFIEINDFYVLLQRVIYPSSSHGRLGGKASGLILASQVLRKSSQTNEFLRNIKTPKTWYLTSDTILYFISHNDLDEIVEQKYEDIERVRQEYPYVVHVFKNSPLPPEIMNGLSVALDDFGESPLIVRSSSLLEDRPGTSFAGKYKSLFIANQGTKRERLAALADAITEVYASTFSPDALEYRAEHGMVDFHEEMGILIQEVVGKKVGHYFVPAFAGVIFANNDFRWSPRIRREDGLLRLVPGLGTRAVDRLSDDYPVLVSPGQPNLRVNVTLEEKIRYSPRKIDVINQKTNSFETMDVSQLLAQFGNEYPAIRHVVSILRSDRLEVPGGLGIESATDPLIVT